jgi:hypothetical protein
MFSKTEDSLRMSNFKHLLFILFTAFSTTSEASVLWDNWYTVTDHGHPDSYYNEKAEITGERAKIQVNTWIKQGKKIRSEALGAVAKNTALLEPLLYNFRTQTEAGEDKIIDGSIIDKGKVFSVKIKTGVETEKPLRAEMLPKLILASFFPMWINKNYKRISGVQPIEFQAIVEDQVEGTVPVVKGDAYEMRQDDFAKKTNTRKLRINFNRVIAFWWVTPKGDAIQIQVPQLERLVKKVDQKTAEAFLKEL